MERRGKRRKERPGGAIKKDVKKAEGKRETLWGLRKLACALRYSVSHGVRVRLRTHT